MDWRLFINGVWVLSLQFHYPDGSRKATKSHEKKVFMAQKRHKTKFRAYAIEPQNSNKSNRFSVSAHPQRLAESWQYRLRYVHNS